MHVGPVTVTGEDSGRRIIHDGNTQLIPGTTAKKVSRPSSHMGTARKKRGEDTPWLDTTKENIDDFIPMKDNKYVMVAQAALNPKPHPCLRNLAHYVPIMMCASR